jgi:hypothetical protein
MHAKVDAALDARRALDALLNLDLQISELPAQSCRRKDDQDQGQE